VIGVRAFGSDPEIVTSYARAAHLGLRDGGLLSCAKHFPGHGDTEVDSHLALPVVSHPRERLERVELVPFRALLGEVPAVMVAHLACPALGDEMLPATLAPRIATGLLRDELRFAGLAITDSMDMQGVASAFGFEEAAVRALLAGCDLLLYCFEIDKPQRARDALGAALESGRLPRARLEEAAGRVARLQASAAAATAVAPGAVSDAADAAAAARYRGLCQRALDVHDPAAWRRIAHAARQHGRLILAGWQEDLLARLAGRLGGYGVTVQTVVPETLTPELGVPVVVVLGERRPLLPERVGCLRRLALAHESLALANLLTPEVDAPLVESFTTILRSADHTDVMLDVVAARMLAS
jgi:beta-glucosidase-like glycosyl hydrolase